MASTAATAWDPDATVKPYGDNAPLTLPQLVAIGAAHPVAPVFKADPSFLDAIPRHVLLGYVDESGPRSVVTYPNDRGLLTVAPNRSGKGVSAIGVNAICHRGSFVCFDPKHENTDLYARWRSEVLGQPTFVFDPLHVLADADLPAPPFPGHPLRAGFNPLEFIAKSRHPVADAKMCASAFIPIQGTNPFWSESAQSFFAAAHCFVALDPNYFKARTYENLWSDLTELPEAEFRGMLEVMADSKVCNGFVRREAIEFMEGSVDTVKGYRKTLKTQAGRILDDPDIIKCLSHTTVDFGRLQREKVSIFLVLPGEFSKQYGNFMRVILSFIFSAIERCGLPEPGSTRERTLVILDEFATMGRSDALLEAMPRLPGYGVTIWPFCQDLGQVRTLYGDGWETFVAAAGVLQAFGGTPDQFTAEYLSKKTGSVTETTISQSDPAVGNHQSRTTASTSRPGMFPYEFSNLNADPKDERLQVLFYAGKGYTKAQRLLTYEDFPAFTAFRRQSKIAGATRTETPRQAPQDRPPIAALPSPASAGPSPDGLFRIAAAPAGAFTVSGASSPAVKPSPSVPRVAPPSTRRGHVPSIYTPHASDRRLGPEAHNELAARRYKALSASRSIEGTDEAQRRWEDFEADLHRDWLDS